MTAPNRFYAVPHATGHGWHQPMGAIALRAMKAEGGWGVVNTEYCSIHPSSDDDPYPSATLWDDEELSIDLQVAGLSLETGQYIARSIRQLHYVDQVLISEKTAA